MISKVHKKLSETKLFSDAQKVELFAMLPDAPQDDLRKLEAGIDAFDRQYRRMIAKRTKQIQDLLVQAVSEMSPEERDKNQEGIDELNLGLVVLAS